MYVVAKFRIMLPFFHHSGQKLTYFANNNFDRKNFDFEIFAL